MLIDDFALGLDIGQISLLLLDNIIVVFISVPVLHLLHFINSIIGSTLVVQALQVEELPMGTV